MDEKTANHLLNKVKKDYNQIAEYFSSSREKAWSEFEDYASQIKKNQKILDMGCGNGRFYSFLKSKGISSNYYGIDISENLISIAQKKHPEAKFETVDMLKMNFPNHYFDVICAIASIHHIPSKRYRNKLLNKIFNLLKEDGKFLMSVWNLDQKQYKQYITKTRDSFIPWKKGKKIERYYYAYKAEELEEELTSAGFEILESTINNNIIYICQKSKSKY